MQLSGEMKVESTNKHVIFTRGGPAIQLHMSAIVQLSGVHCT